MVRVVRALTGVALACALSPAHALTQTIKREVPLNIPGVAQKGTPIRLAGAYWEDAAFDGTQVWVPDRGNNQVLRFDIASNKQVGQAIPMPSGPRKVIFDGTYVWIMVLGDPKIYRYTTAGVASGSASLPGTSDQGIFDGDYIWAVAYSNEAGTTLNKVDVKTRAVTTYSDFPGGVIGFDGRNVWISTDQVLYKYDVSGALTGAPPVLAGTINGLTGATGTSGITFDGEFLWVNSDMGTQQVYKIDVNANTVVETKDVYPGVHGSAFDGNLLWVVCSDAVVKIDVHTNAIVGVVQLPPESYAHDIVFDGKFMWVTAGEYVYKYFAHF